MSYRRQGLDLLGYSSRIDLCQTGCWRPRLECFCSVRCLIVREPMLKKMPPLPRVLSALARRGAGRAFGTILLGWVIMLLVGSLAPVDGPFQHDRGRAAPYDTSQLFKTELPGLSTVDDRHRAGAALLAAVSSHPLQAGELGSGPQRTASDDIDPDDECCGVSCHAAAGNRIDGRSACRSFVVIPPVELPDLDGESQDPLERPPRLA